MSGGHTLPYVGMKMYRTASVLIAYEYRTSKVCLAYLQRIWTSWRMPDDRVTYLTHNYSSRTLVIRRIRCSYAGAGRSSEVERSLMVRWVFGSILHGVDPLSYLSFQPVLHDWCNKGRGMCYPVCGMVDIK